MRHFENFVRFFKPDGKGSLTNYYELNESRLQPLVAKIGDIWRFFVPKSDVVNDRLQSEAATIKVELWGRQFSGCQYTGDGALAEIGFLRRQQSELYYEMILKVNNAPPEDTYKQFALTRANGKIVFGTFKSQTTDFNDYCEELKVWLEKYPHTRVDVIRDGNLLKIRTWESGNFRIRNENLTVSIGEVKEMNANTPTLNKEKIETYNKPAFYTYEIEIGADITQGNTFTLQDVVYVATDADTPASIKKILMGEQDLIYVDEGDLLNIGVVPGVTQTINTNNPQIVKLYKTTSMGNDNYKIEVENVTKGNIFQVIGTGATTIQVIADENDTKATVEAVLNPDSGFYSIPIGETVTVNAVPGIREDVNTNYPNISTKNATLTSEQITDKYRIYVGTSVRERNIFVLGNKTVIADSEDTYLTIANKLGLIDGQYYEVIEGTQFDAYAKKGALYGDANIADVQMISSPIRRVSMQWMCEIEFLQAFAFSPREGYQIAINSYNEDDELTTIGISNYINVLANPKDTYLLSFADLGEKFGFQYYEEGISQQVRVPVFLRNQRLITSEVQRESVNDATVKGQIKLRKQFDFETKGYGSWFHRAMQVALNSKMAFLDEKKVTLVEYTENDEIGAKKIISAKGTFIEDNYLMKNYGKLFLSNDNYKEKVSVITKFQSKIIALVLFNNYIYHEITEQGEVFIHVGEYKWKVFVGGALGQSIKMKIFQNGILIQTVTLLCSRWNTLDKLIRTYPYQELIFEEINQDSTIQNLVTSEESYFFGTPGTYEDEIGDIDDRDGYIIPEIAVIPDDTGAWRLNISGVDLNFDKMNEDSDWITKLGIR